MTPGRLGGSSLTLGDVENHDGLSARRPAFDLFGMLLIFLSHSEGYPDERRSLPNSAPGGAG